MLSADRLRNTIADCGRSILFEIGSPEDVGRHARRFHAHLHALSLRFHLERQTGGLTVLALRGVRGIRYILENMLFNIVPTAAEIVLVCLILTKLYDLSYTAIVLLTVVPYVVSRSC